MLMISTLRKHNERKLSKGHGDNDGSNVGVDAPAVDLSPGFQPYSQVPVAGNTTTTVQNFSSRGSSRSQRSLGGQIVRELPTAGAKIVYNVETALPARPALAKPWNTTYELSPAPVPVFCMAPQLVGPTESVNRRKQRAEMPSNVSYVPRRVVSEKYDTKSTPRGGSSTEEAVCAQDWLEVSNALLR